VAADFHVQLVHVAKETSWSDQDAHGFVALKSASGTVLVRKGGFQHNVNLRKGGAFDATAVAMLVAVAQKAAASGALKEGGIAVKPLEQRPSFIARLFRRSSSSSAGAPAAASA